MPEAKVLLSSIEGLKTSTGAKVERDENGEVVSSRLMTRFQFDCEVPPEALADIHRLLKNAAAVHALIGSPQSVMDIADRSSSFPEKD